MKGGLKLEQVVRRFGDTLALDSITSDIPGGVFASILGPSGCGKSTLLRVIAGLERVDSGKLWIDGAEVSTDVSAERRGVGMMFQSPTLFPHLNVFENVAFPLRVRGIAAEIVETRVAAMLEMVRLRDRASAAVRDLSGGQAQRVALARALVFEPAVLLLDEPLAALERPLREQLQLDLRDMQRRTGATFLMVTHDRDEAMAVSDLILVMQAGRFEQSGAPRDIWARPRTRFVARFLLSANVVAGEVAIEGAAWSVRSVGGTVLHRGAGAPPATSEVHVSIAPGAVRLEPLLEPAPANALAGTVSNARFAGADTIVTLDTPLGPFIARMSSEFAADLPAGRKLRAHFDPAATVVLEPGPA